MDRSWNPLGIEAVAARFAVSDIDWWIAGGVAIDLYLGWVTRVHEDLDIEMFRSDREALFEVFDGWDLHTVSEGRFQPLSPDQELEPSVFGIWGRPTPTDSWAVEVILADGDSDTWRFRRDPAITMPRAALTRTTADGIRYCSPEVQLLYKAKRARPKDDLDFTRCLHHLEPDQRRWLRSSLARMEPDHPWLAALDGSLRLTAEPG